MRGKTGKFNPKQSREVHVGRNPSNLTANTRTFVMCDAMGVDCKFLNFRVNIAKLLKLHGLKVIFFFFGLLFTFYFYYRIVIDVDVHFFYYGFDGKTNISL
jgi:hypothetical protein